MTKKETTILRGMYDEAMDNYMAFVLKHENAPADILERACIMTDIYKTLIKDNSENNDNNEVGA